MHQPCPPGPASGRWRRDFPGEPRQVPVMRRWLAGLLDDCPARDDVLTVATELASNACLHSNSRLPGGQFGVELARTPGTVTVAVADGGGGPSAPSLISDPSGQHGNGLRLVCALATRTEITGGRQGRSFLASIPSTILAGTIQPAVHNGLLPEGR